MKKILVLITFICLSCKNPFYEELSSITALDNDTIIEDEIPIDRDFNYETTIETTYNIDTIYGNVPIEIHYENRARVMGISNSSGKFVGTTTLPIYVNEVKLVTNYLGLINSVLVPIYNNDINYKYLNSRSFNRGKKNRDDQTDYLTLGSWDTNGVPNYLVEKEELDESFITLLNSVLPEKQPVPEYNPQYLNDGALTNINIVEDGEVFVTFIHEGAGYKNSLLFFTYKTQDGPPNSISPEDLVIIYPNVSYTGSGGGLETGNRVKIGDFTSGTTIAWALIANGFENNQTVGSGENIFYSVDSLNPESMDYNQHVVQIAFEDRVVFSFEDLLRPDGDNDFNDAIFSVSSNPHSAIDTQSIITPEESSTLDSDGDGVLDSYDPYPMDSRITGVEYYPSKNSYGTLAFEDLWPHMGDYDFNDLVVDIRFEENINSDGNIVSIKGFFLIQGILASMNNGFAVELGVESSRVESVTGGEFSRGYILRAANGVENRQRKAVIGVFENANQHYVNNVGTEIEVHIIFNSPVLRVNLGYPPYNPFLISNGERGREVHLPGHSPTDLAHQPYFNSADDSSSFINGDSYKTDTEHPWALNLPVSFKYPIDDKAINKTYNYFDNWVETRGELSSDWFLDNAGYINHQCLFVK